MEGLLALRQRLGVEVPGGGGGGVLRVQHGLEGHGHRHRYVVLLEVRVRFLGGSIGVPCPRDGVVLLLHAVHPNYAVGSWHHLSPSLLPALFFFTGQ